MPVLRFSLPSIVIALAILGAPGASRAQPLAGQAAVPRLSAAESWERLRLPAEEIDLEVDALGARISLAPRSGSVAALAKALRERPSALCPKTSLDEGRLVLRCRTRRIEAKIASLGRDRYLDIHEVRGLPIDESFGAEPRLFWDPPALRLGGSCPGDTAFARGECALLAGRDDEARARFGEALADDRAVGAASIRLGDLAARQGDRALAAEHYRRAGRLGFWGRLGTARTCELLGGCLGTVEEARVFDPVGLPEPLHSELVLRHARALSFQDGHAQACRLLSGKDRACGIGANLCRRIALEAMRSERPEDREEGLALFLTLDDRLAGPLAFDLSTAAAEVAAAAGAPFFAANTLSVMVEFAPKSRLADHLLRTAQLYLDARDPVRAGVIADFATRRLPARTLESKAWAAVRAALRAPDRQSESGELKAAREALDHAASLGPAPGT